MISLYSILLSLVYLFSGESDTFESGTNDNWIIICIIAFGFVMIVLLFVLYICCIVAFGMILAFCIRCGRRSIVEELKEQGGTRSSMNLVLRPGFKEKYPRLHSKDFRLGKFYYADDGKRVQLLDLEYRYRHRDVECRGDTERKFSDIFYNLRSGKYTPYSHCKYCFQEQETFYKNFNSLCCVKCGLPVIRYIDFEEDERYCCVCALMNKYHPRPHIRCLLHPSGKGKKLGAMYVLYKEFYSISSASKPKKKTPKSTKLEKMLHPEHWKLNSGLRFEYLWSIRRLIRFNLTSQTKSKNTLRILNETKEEIVERVREIGPNMLTSYQEHGLDINLKGDEFSRENKMKFFVCLRENLEAIKRKCEDHTHFLKQREIHYPQNELMKPTYVGLKRKFRDMNTFGNNNNNNISVNVNGNGQTNRASEPMKKRLKINNMEIRNQPIMSVQQQMERMRKSVQQQSNQNLVLNTSIPLFEPPPLPKREFISDHFESSMVENPNPGVFNVPSFMQLPPQATNTYDPKSFQNSHPSLFHDMDNTKVRGKGKQKEMEKVHKIPLLSKEKKSVRRRKRRDSSPGQYGNGNGYSPKNMVQNGDKSFISSIPFFGQKKNVVIPPPPNMQQVKKKNIGRFNRKRTVQVIPQPPPPPPQVNKNPNNVRMNLQELNVPINQILPGSTNSSSQSNRGIYATNKLNGFYSNCFEDDDDTNSPGLSGMETDSPSRYENDYEIGKGGGGGDDIEDGLNEKRGSDNLFKLARMVNITTSGSFDGDELKNIIEGDDIRSNSCDSKNSSDSLHLSSRSHGSSVVDFSNSFKREHMILDEDLFESKGVVIDQKDMPKYDVDEYIASYTYDEREIEVMIDGIESPRTGIVTPRTNKKKSIKENV